MQQEAVDLLRKKDSDARIFREGNDLILETTIPLLSEEEPTPILNGANLFVVQKEAPDIQVQVVHRIFLAHQFVTFGWFVLCLPLYFWDFGNVALVSLLVISTCVSVIMYVSAFALRKTNANAAFSLYVCWALCLGTMLGCVTGMTDSWIPLQLELLLWAQCIAMIAYTKWSSRYINYSTCFVFMVVATLVVWCIFIAAFIEQHDWPAAGVLLIVALACCAYNTFAIWRCCTHHAYNVAWPDTVRSIVNFYCELILLILKE